MYHMEKSKPLDLSRMSHSELKDSGNRFFAASDNTRAIECYTLAIKKNGSISTYYSNRALCYLQMKLYDRALADCRRALELDPSNLKAFFFAGQCHLALGHYDEAVAKLTTAHSLALETHKNFGDDIAASIRLAKRKRFEQLDEKRRQEEIEFQVYLSKLILEDGERRLKALQEISAKEEGEDASKKSEKKVTNNMESFSPSESGRDTPDGDRDSASVDVQVSIRRLPPNASQIDSETAARLRDLDAIFAQVDERRMKRELPDYLCGQISFELMQDPVITPSGITYDRQSIQAHLRQVGHFDPITRQPLTQDQLIPNLAMKEHFAPVPLPIRPPVYFRYPMNHSSKNRSRSPIDRSWYPVTTSSSDSSPHLRSTVVEGEFAPSTIRTRSSRRRHQELLEGTASRATRVRSTLTQRRRSPRSVASVTVSDAMDKDVGGGSSALSFNTEGSDDFVGAGPQTKLLRDRMFDSADAAAILTKDSNADDDCAICRDRKVNQSYLLPCMHTYCFQCILQWVRINPTCPLCKALVRKIIHSINSDSNFKEYDIRSSPRNVINLMTPIVNLLNTSLHRSSLAVSNTSGAIFHPEPRSTLLMTLVVRALRTTTTNPNLLRRLVYVNKFYTYPAPLPAHSNTAETLSYLTRCTSRSFLAENEALQTRLIDFTQRELFYLAPWVDYMHSNRGAAATQPLGGGNSNPSEALGRLSMGIVCRIASHLVPLTRVDDFADAIRGIDDRDQGGDGLLESVSTSALKHFSWELLQFARFSGTLQEYYSQSCLYANHFTGGHMRLEHSPPMHTAVYTTPGLGGVAADGFANSLEGVSKETAQWLYRHLFNAPRSPFMSFTPHPDDNIIRTACQTLQCLASYNPSRLVNSNDSVYHLRRQGIRGLLSRMAEQTWSDEVAQMGLCELIDQARIGSAMERLTHHGRHLVLRRIANLIAFFSQPTYAVRPNTPLPSVESKDHGEASQPPLRLTRPHTTSLREANAITIALGEDDSETEGDNDEAIIVSDSEESSTQQSSSGCSSIPRCCVEHRKHCCCCYRRRSAEHMRPTEFAHMFKAFIEFYEERRSRRRLRPQMLNRPSSPIVISDDDDEVEDEPEPQPGPSRPRQESPQQTPPRQSIKLAEDNPVRASEELPSVIIRPTTANEFYSLLNQAMDCEEEIPNASVPMASSSQPAVKQEEPQRPARPTSAPS